jgi:DEAD/DEAH box helicase domain-containing protein
VDVVEPLDALRLTDSLRQRLVDFTADDHHVRDTNLRDIVRAIWSGPPSEGGLTGDLWVESSPPAMASKRCLDDLVRARKFDARLADQLDRTRAVPRSRPLYEHQLQAIEAARAAEKANRPALVVTAPTGAGKTESFLLPVLDDLQTVPRATGLRGVRSLILYPMNALVNDQVERLYSWLRGQDRITLFHFTSETPEDHKSALNRDLPPYDACRMRTREQARGRENHGGAKLADNCPRGPQPDILVSNYSMLEYMLCRPQDATFFGPGLRSIVLDEAHLYTGTLAAEITLLLRRVLDRCGLRPSDVLHVATSATLGRGDPAELRAFASKLFTKSPEFVNVIEGRSARNPMAEEHPPLVEPDAASVVARAWLTGPTLNADARGEISLSTSAEACQALAEDLRVIVDPESVAVALRSCGDRPAVLLRDVLEHAPILHRIDEELYKNRHLKLEELADRIWGSPGDESVEATIKLLQVGAAARGGVGDYPLLPHRLHVLVRPADGLVACLNADCTGDARRKLDGLGRVWPGLSDRCGSCGSATMTIHRCGNCGEWGLAAVESDGEYRPVPPRPKEGSVERFARSAVGVAKPIGVAPATGRRSPSSTLKLWAIEDCPRCGVTASKEWRPLESGSPLSLSIVAESLLAGLPEYPSPEAALRPARGRRLLAFSDSRAEAARLGPRLTLQHEIQVARATITRFVEGGALAADAATVADLCEEITVLRVKLARPGLTDPQCVRFERELAQKEIELKAARQGGTIDLWTEALSRDPTSKKILRELLDSGRGEKHKAEGWAAEAWDGNAKSIIERLPSLVARELARPARGQISLETAGLIEVAYPGIESVPADSAFLGSISKTVARGMIRDAWTDFLAALCDSIRSEGAVTLGEKGDLEYPLGEVLVGRWCSAEGEGYRLFRLIGTSVRQVRRRFSAFVLEAAGLPLDEAIARAPDLLRSGFEAIRSADLPWVEKASRPVDNGEVPAIRIEFSKLGLKHPATPFLCDKTGHYWSRSVLGCAPEAGCESLRPTDHASLDDDPRLGRLRREYKTSIIFSQGLWAEEHSAQLDPAENRRLQDLFRAGIRNVLSSTTTLELGIDIGGLSCVLMGNVPPGKANYLQRAGRAGRRADGSSIVVTFARPRPYDREVFGDLGSYLGRPLRSPTVLLRRERLGLRHARAYLLGEFFREVYPEGHKVGAMRAYGMMGRFCGVEQVASFWKAGRNRPSVEAHNPYTLPSGLNWGAKFEAGLAGEFLSFLEWAGTSEGRSRLSGPLSTLLHETPALADLGRWDEFIRDVRSEFASAIGEWRRDYESVLGAWKEISGDGPADRARANALTYQLDSLADTTVIEVLADRQVLPRYGFPIGMLKLRVTVAKPDRSGRDRVRDEDQFRLERGGLLALREYAPGSKLLVGGKVVTSRGLMKHWTGANVNSAFGLRGIGSTCENGHFSYRLDSKDSFAECPVCGGQPNGPPDPLILPRHGFTTAAWDPPRRGTEVENAGSVDRATISFARGEAGTSRVEDFGDVLGMLALYREDGEILVYHKGEKKRGFAICVKCGYAESEPVMKIGEKAEGLSGLPMSFKRHASLDEPNDKYQCLKHVDSSPLRRQVLAARETTDVLLLNLDLCLPRMGDDEEAVIETLARALLASGARLLDLDSRELGCFPLGRGVVLHDNVPGGAGHVGELFDRHLAQDRGRSWLLETVRILRGDDTHNARCETACLDCLLTFDAQEAMSRGLLQRRSALAIWEKMLDEKG